MESIYVIITTYNRPKMCRRLTAELRAAAALVGRRGADIQIAVHDDGSDLEYRDWAATVYRHSHHGKPLYWRLVWRAFQIAKAEKWKYLVMLPDDVTLPDQGALSRMVQQYNALPGRPILCLNVLADKGRTGIQQWSRKKPQRQRLRGGIGPVWEIGWTDLAFICRRNFINEALRLPWNSRVYDARRESSGVGAFLSRGLYRKGRFYQVAQTLVHHGAHESKMHPDHRRRTPLIT